MDDARGGAVAGELGLEGVHGVGFYCYMAAFERAPKGVISRDDTEGFWREGSTISPRGYPLSS